VSLAVDQLTTLPQGGISMKRLYYIGFDVHKKTIVYCVKDEFGRVVERGSIAASRASLGKWAESIGHPWVGALEATLFTGWIYDFLKPYAVELKVAHPAMLKAISASKKKNDRDDAERIVDLLRCDLLPECYMASHEIRELRRILRYRNLMVREAIKMKNKTAGLLMEVGAEYNKKRIHTKRYFNDFLENIENVPESVISMLRLSRSSLEMFEQIQKKLVKELRENEGIKERVERLMTIAGIGEITALTWVLEIGDPFRFHNNRQAISYCGLCSAQRESAGKERRGPISKQRNKHLQTILIEAAKLAPRRNPELAEVYVRELAKGNHNRATLAVARKLVAYLLAVDKRQTGFIPKEHHIAA
jgi:transposase